MELARRHDLHIIEDCAHAIETQYKGKNAGTFGDFGCFSFYVTKNVVTGEGGMVLAADEQHAAQIKVLALHGMSRDAWKRYSDEGYKHYDVVNAGFKYNMMDLQAAIGIHQLRESGRELEEAEGDLAAVWGGIEGVAGGVAGGAGGGDAARVPPLSDIGGFGSHGGFAGWVH
jgi:dTDP-4-amino-4,6-dideoxygalactose transaminase